jgi:hypothetical protein
MLAKEKDNKDNELVKKAYKKLHNKHFGIVNESSDF